MVDCGDINFSKASNKTLQLLQKQLFAFIPISYSSRKVSTACLKRPEQFFSYDCEGNEQYSKIKHSRRNCITPLSTGSTYSTFVNDVPLLLASYNLTSFPSPSFLCKVLLPVLPGRWWIGIMWNRSSLQQWPSLTHDTLWLALCLSTETSLRMEDLWKTLYTQHLTGLCRVVLVWYNNQSCQYTVHSTVHHEISICISILRATLLSKTSPHTQDVLGPIPEGDG